MRWSSSRRSCVDDVERHICVGYRDIRHDEFWVSGHMPGHADHAGRHDVRAAAQVLTYHIQRNDLSGAEVVGFGGLDGVKFRGVVRPGDRLIMVVPGDQASPRADGQLPLSRVRRTSRWCAKASSARRARCRRDALQLRIERSSHGAR